MDQDANVAADRPSVIRPTRVAPCADAHEVILVCRGGALAAVGGGSGRKHAGDKARAILLIIIANEDPPRRRNGREGAQVLRGRAVVRPDGYNDTRRIWLGAEVCRQGDRSKALVVVGDAQVDFGHLKE